MARKLPLTYRYLERFKDRFTARKSRIFTQKPFYGLFGLDRKEEAHFVCAVLNSELVHKFLTARSGKSKRGLSKKVMEQLRLPRFNPADNRHLELASWSLKMHQGLKMPDEGGNKVEYLVEEVFRTQREWQQGLFSFVEVPHSV